MPTPDLALDDTQRQLLSKGIIDLMGNVDGEMAGYVRFALTYLTANGSPPITLRLTSNGGNADMGLDICDLLRLYPGSKTGIVLSYANSMAAVILQCCDRRLCARNGQICIHDIRCEALPLLVLENPRLLRRRLHEPRRLQALLDQIIISRTKMSPRKLHGVYLRDQAMNAEEALAAGLIDEIV